MDLKNNQRKSPRVTAINFVSVIEVNYEHLQESGYLSATLNLSKGGLLFESKYPFPLLATLKLSMTLKDNVIDITGRVVRLEEISEGRIAVGIHFTEIPPESKEAISQYLKEKKQNNS